MKRILSWSKSAVVAVSLASSFGAYASEATRPAVAVPDGQRRVPPPKPNEAGQRPTIEVVFVLDTTGSMGGLLAGAKQKIWSIASRIAAGKPTPHVKVGLVAYRDVGDAYVTKKFDLSDDLDSVYANLQTFQAEGGGDWPEHVGRGLADAVGKMSWSDGKTMKMIFVVGDAPPSQHPDDYRYEVWAKKAAERGIVINTVRCGDAPDTEIAWRKIAKLADGTFVSINQSGGMVATATPFDDKLASLNTAIASKTVYGGEGRGKARKKAEEIAVLPAAQAADRMSFAASGAGSGMAARPEAGAVDLTAEPEQAAALPTAALPEEMQTMDKDERVQHAQKLSTERKALEAEAKKVAQERDAYLAKQKPAKKDAFDEQVMNQVKEKAASFGIAY